MQSDPTEKLRVQGEAMELRGRVLHREARASRGWEMNCCGKASNDRQCSGTARQGTAKESHCSEWYRTAGALQGEVSKRHCSAVLGNGEAWSGYAMATESAAKRQRGYETRRKALRRCGKARRGSDLHSDGNAPHRRATATEGYASPGTAKARRCSATRRQGTALT